MEKISLFFQTNRFGRIKVILQVLMLLAVVGKYRLRSGSHLQLLNDRLRMHEPWQILAVLAASWLIMRNWSLLLGLAPPASSLIREPDNNYSKSFQRVRWFLNSWDAAILSTLRIRNPLIRHTMSTALAFWYAIFYERAESKIEDFRRSLSVRYVRACWEKGKRQPFLRFLSSVATKRLPVHMEPIVIAGVPCYIYYAKDRRMLAEEKRCVVAFPGGGFIAMDPECHADWHSAVARASGLPLISIDYRKAPEAPFPCGLNDCFRVYQQIVLTEGSVAGLNLENCTKLSVVVMGDSAGGNFCAAVTFKAMHAGVRVPTGVHMIYPSLDMSADIWLSATSKSDAYSTSLARNSIDVFAVKTFGAKVAAAVAKEQPRLSTRALYAHDGVLPLRFMLLTAQALFRAGGDPLNDWLASPIRAPVELMMRFPPVFIHVGAVDPLCDDSVTFIEKIRAAQGKNALVRLYRIPGCSHAYMNAASLLPEGRDAVALSARWVAELSELPLPPTQPPFLLPNMPKQPEERPLFQGAVSECLDRVAPYETSDKKTASSLLQSHL